VNTTKKPVFVYGTLKTGEIAYHQTAELVENAVPAYLNNFALYIRDGIPLVIPTQGYGISGELLYAYPKSPYKNSFYQKNRKTRIEAKYWVETACFHVWIDEDVKS